MSEVSRVQDGWSSHGHWIGEGEPTSPQPSLVARCGGPGKCPVCTSEKAALVSRVQEPEPRVWEMHGHAADNGVWVAVGSEFYVRIHGYGPPPVPVRVTEDADGDYMGWLEDQFPGPTLIQHRKIFDIQFPYGHKAEVERGRGEAVRLRIEEVSRG